MEQLVALGLPESVITLSDVGRRHKVSKFAMPIAHALGVAVVERGCETGAAPAGRPIRQEVSRACKTAQSICIKSCDDARMYKAPLHNLQSCCSIQQCSRKMS